MPQQAIDFYHALLETDLGAESQAQLEQQLRARGLFFGERPLCSVLRPRFLSAEQYRFLHRQVTVLLGALARTYRAAQADPMFRRQFGLMDWEEDLITHDPGFDDPSPVSRLDAFFSPERGGLRFTEYNAETPAGAAFCDLLSYVFLGLPVMREFLRRFEIRPQPARHHVQHALIRSYRHWSGRRDTPHVAILDWREVPTFAEFRITAEYLESQGIPCTIADPREVEYRDGKLVYGDFHINVIYKRVLIRELIERGGRDHPVVRAVLEGAACMVNPFRCKILHKKATLAVLTDERNHALFTSGEHAVIDRHIPWTRIVEERCTLFHEQQIDLLPYIAEHRDRFVLKPNDEYGGAGIVLGWECDSEKWVRSVQAAVGNNYVVQERVALPIEVFPVSVGGRVEFVERMLDTAPFVFHGAYMDGCLTRLSGAGLINVSAGEASSVPTFIVEGR